MTAVLYKDGDTTCMFSVVSKHRRIFFVAYGLPSTKVMVLLIIDIIIAQWHMG